MVLIMPERHSEHFTRKNSFNPYNNSMRQEYIIISILWIWKQRHRKVRCPAQDGRVRKWWAWDRSLGSLAPESMHVTTMISSPSFRSAHTSPSQRGLSHFP